MSVELSGKEAAVTGAPVAAPSRDGRRFQQACVWCGIATPLLFFGAFISAGFIPPLSPHASAPAVAAFYRHHLTGIRLGGLLMLLSGMFYAAFSGVISVQMRRIPGSHPAAHYVQLCAGAFACLTFLVPAMVLEVAAFRPARPPEITQTLDDMFWILLVMPWTPFLTENWAFAYAILKDRRSAPLFPRWLAWVNLAAPLIFAPSVLLPFFRTGAFDWGGVFVFWIPAVAFVLQFVANVVYLLRAVGDEYAPAPGQPAEAAALG